MAVVLFILAQSMAHRRVDNEQAILNSYQHFRSWYNANLEQKFSPTKQQVPTWSDSNFQFGRAILPPDVIRVTKTVAIRVPYPKFIYVPHNIPYPIPYPVSKPFPVEVTKIVDLQNEPQVVANYPERNAIQEQNQQTDIKNSNIVQICCDSSNVNTFNQLQQVYAQTKNNFLTQQF